MASLPRLLACTHADLPGAAPAAEVAEALGLSELRRNAYHIKACTAKTPPGRSPDARIKEGLEWLLEAVGQVGRLTNTTWVCCRLRAGASFSSAEH